MSTKVSLILIIAIGQLFSNSVFAAPIQWLDNNHWYELVPVNNTRSTWAYSRDHAAAKTFIDPNTGETLQGHLATITSEAENTFIDITIGGIGWIGGFQDPNSSDPDQGWHWVTGELWDYTNWSDLEPNDQGPGSGDPLYVENNGENALEIWTNGKWNDFIETSKPSRYVIEYETINAVPVPATIWLFLSGFALLTFSANKRLRPAEKC